MTAIGAYEAKTHLPRLLGEVEAGASFTITRHGNPIARLVPVRPQPGGEDLVAAFAEARRGKTLGMTLRDAIDEGRR